jgi:hypothetical protein
VPGAFASRFAHERDTPSCRATAAAVMPAIKGSGDDVPLCYFESRPVTTNDHPLVTRVRATY